MRRSRNGILLVGAALTSILMGAAIMTYDVQWSNRLRQDSWSGDLEKLIELSEFFAHGLTVALLFLTLLWVDQGNRRGLLIAVLVTVSAGLGANLVKLAFSRVRPHSLEVLEVGQSPSGWLPNSMSTIWESAHRSFPSGHTATAFGLACGLSLVYPRGWFLFFIYASLAGLQRIESGAHYPSDVLAGAGLGMAVGGVIYVVTARRQLLQATSGGNDSDACS